MMVCWVLSPKSSVTALRSRVRLCVSLGFLVELMESVMGITEAHLWLSNHVNLQQISFSV